MTMTEDSILLAQLEDIPEAGAMEWKCEVPELISIILYKLNGQVFAYRNTCPHQGRPLGLGKGGPQGGQRFFFDQQRQLVCPHHGALFQMDSGNCVAGPCRGEALKKVAIHIEGEQVFLNEDLFIRAEN